MHSIKSDLLSLFKKMRVKNAAWIHHWKHSFCMSRGKFSNNWLHHFIWQRRRHQRRANIFRFEIEWIWRKNIVADVERRKKGRNSLKYKWNPCDSRANWKINQMKRECVFGANFRLHWAQTCSIHLCGKRCKQNRLSLHHRRIWDGIF